MTTAKVALADFCGITTRASACVATATRAAGWRLRYNYQTAERTSCRQALPSSDFSDWHSERSLNGPAEHVNAICDSSSIDAGFSLPFRQMAVPSGKREYSRVALVASLLSASGPSAVAWRVRTVVVDAFDRMARRWCRSNIRNERLERLPPVVSHYDTAPAVAWIFAPRRVVAARLYSEPDFVLTRVPQSMNKSHATNSTTPAGFRWAQGALIGAVSGALG